MYTCSGSGELDILSVYQVGFLGSASEYIKFSISADPKKRLRISSQRLGCYKLPLSFVFNLSKR